MVGSLVILLLQIFSWLWRWKNFENRLIFDEVKAYKKWCQFYGANFWATLYILFVNQYPLTQLTWTAHFSGASVAYAQWTAVQGYHPGIFLKFIEHCDAFVRLRCIAVLEPQRLIEFVCKKQRLWALQAPSLNTPSMLLRSEISLDSNYRLPCTTPLSSDADVLARFVLYSVRQKKYPLKLFAIFLATARNFYMKFHTFITHS